MEIHPFAASMPAMTDDEYESLKDSVRTHGLLYPGLMWRGLLIDGCHRMRACEELGVPFRTAEVDSAEDAIELIVDSLNEDRRQRLTESQRAMVAARRANLKRGDNQHRRQEVPSGDGTSCSQSDAAKLLGVGVKSVERAAKVLRAAVPEVVSAVEAGGLPVSLAAKVADLPPDVQRRVAASDDPRGAAAAAVRPAVPAEGEGDDDERAAATAAPPRPRPGPSGGFPPEGPGTDPAEWASFFSALAAVSEFATRFQTRFVPKEVESWKLVNMFEEAARRLMVAAKQLRQSAR